MFVQGRLALDSKRYADAKVIFARASTACPTDAYPPATLGFIADTIDHDPAAAKKFYSEALTRKWSANSETAVLNYSAILATEGSLQEARRVMEDALPKMGGNASLLHNLAVVCKQAGDTESSQNYFTRYKSLVAAKAE
jgi:Flp pilus assembly protein TadD